MQPADHDAPFDRMFRGLGAWLDDRSPSHFSVLEGESGFTVILGEGVPGSRREEIELSRAELMRLDETLVSLRGRKPAYAVPWKAAPTSRQDFLRALGYELRDAGAAAVVMDEVVDSILLTYSYRRDGDPENWHKRSVNLGASEIEEIMRTARGRRRP